ncbi:MAG: hypothetical protein LBU17_08775 [Treponema sp.]|jgi:hypothetical protein|nr:hypothetical protein [Treponema sp.]
MRHDDLKDMGILIGWIAGLILIGCLLWFFTQPIRIQILWSSLARVWQEDSRRLDAPIPRGGLPEGVLSLGTWYTLVDSENRALVFSIMADGMQAPCIAVVSPTGTVVEGDLIPVNRYSKQILEQLPRGIRNIYLRRIEAEAARLPRTAVLVEEYDTEEYDQEEE